MVIKWRVPARKARQVGCRAECPLLEPKMDIQRLPTIAQRIGWLHAFIIERISARRRRVEAVIDRAPQMKGGRIILPNALYLA